ncbi:NADP-dependent oxidoreductase [Rhodococcus koreensis]
MLMRAATVSHFGGPDVVEVKQVPVPEPGPGQVRIAVGAAAVNPVDVAMRAGVFGSTEGESIGLGWDVAGTIDAVGPGVDWALGARVIGLATNHVKPLGTHADYVVLRTDAIAPAPESLDDVHASTLPLNTLSAAQALDLLALASNQTLLITGAAGAVGGHAVELARLRGLIVTAVASADDAAFLQDRGAEDFVVRGQSLTRAHFDGVLDAAGIGGDAIAAVRDGGAYVGLWPGQEPEPERDVRIDALNVQADGAQLAQLSRLADQGAILARVAQTIPLDQAAAAHSRMAEGGLRGRLVLIP